jgi:hypothetical protein
VKLQATRRAVELVRTRHSDLRGLRGKGLTAGSDIVSRGRNSDSGTLPGYMRECDAVRAQLLLTQAARYTLQPTQKLVTPHSLQSSIYRLGLSKGNAMSAVVLLGPRDIFVRTT